jgi:1-phosphofructokinase family hexose kinase
LIFTLTLNPAIDRILFLDDLKKDHTNRIKRQVDTLGGKGTHVSINLKLLDVPNTALGIAFGESGQKIIAMMGAYDVDTRFLHFDNPPLQSRTNYILIEETDHHCTMVTERGPQLSAGITDQLIRQVEELLKPGDMLVLTGDASNVEDTGIYTTLAEKARKLGARVVLDASGPYLKQAISACPYMIKPNHEELSYLAGRELSTENDMIAAMNSLEGIEVIAMTWSDKGALVKCGQAVYRVKPVKSQVVNETGCGDAFLSALIAGIEKDQPFKDVLKMASAVAGAAAEMETTTGFDPARARELFLQAGVERII